MAVKSGEVKVLVVIFLLFYSQLSSDAWLMRKKMMFGDIALNSVY